jgi:fatty-acyl-CoA synthase/citronellyl-CoA synthetase
MLSGLKRSLPEAPQAINGVKSLISVKPDDFNSLGLVLEMRAEKSPNNLAILQGEKRYTYKDINEWTNRYSQYLQSVGFKSGDVISIMIENRPEALIAALAVAKMGGIAAMINTAQRKEALHHSLTLINSQAVIIGEELISAIEEIRSTLNTSLNKNLYLINDPELAELNETVKHRERYTDLDKVSANSSIANPSSTTEVQLKQPCFYIFTSGTTGLPKASIMSHYRWHKAMSGMGMASMRLKETDTLYIPLPLYHNNALTVSLGSVLGNGASLAIARKFSVNNFWSDVRHYNATAFCYIGELCRYLLNNPPSEKDIQHNVRKIIGNGLRPDIWEEFQQRFNIKHINEFYGASECNLVFTNAFNMKATAGFCPLPYKIVKYDIDADKPVINEKGFMIKVSKGEIGLLITKITKRSPFDGYSDKAEGNKKLFLDVFKKEDCYFNTGDLVLNQGYRHIAFVDRLGDTFRWKGENISTTEVEAAINSFNQIEQSVAYGVKIPNTDGRAGMAALTLSCSVNDFDIEVFTQHLKAKLPSYAVPLFLRLKMQQDITGTFKYRKVDLKKEAYNLGQVSDPIFALLPNADAYTPLSPTIESEINSNKFRL